MPFRFRPRCGLRPFRPLLVLCFLLTLGLTLSLGGNLATAQDLRPEIRGVWLTTNDTEVLHNQNKLGTAIQLLAQAKFNTVYPVVWNSGYVKFPSTVAQEAGIQSFIPKGDQGQDILGDIITQAHRNDLLVIPWFEFGFMAPVGSDLADKHPQWLTRMRDGNPVWTGGVAGDVSLLNPFHPEVQKFITDLLVELVTRYDVDGVQFDDHMSLPNEFGYDAYTQALYKKETKKDPPLNPRDPGWMRWRANKLTAFMTQLHDTLSAQKPGLYFSVSPNPYDYAYNAHLQDWVAWVKQGIVDELIVQVYRSDIQSFAEQIDRPEIQETQKLIPTGIGILSGLRNKPASIQQIWQQVLTARDRGLGFSFFYYQSLWDIGPEPPQERQTRFQTLFYYPARRLMSDIFEPAPN